MSKGPLTRQIPMSMVALATALVQANDLHDGIWRVYFKFGINGLNASVNGHLSACALVPVIEVGLMADTQVSDLAVDAAVVNPGSRIALVN